jgi:2'-phosphotransferase
MKSHLVLLHLQPLQNPGGASSGLKRKAEDSTETKVADTNHRRQVEKLKNEIINLKGKVKGKGKEPREVRISKALTRILRHRAVSLSLNIRPDGFIELDAVLKCPALRKLSPNRDEIVAIVQKCDKKRFTVAQIDGSLRIRANQGHSMKEVMDDVLLEPLQPDMAGGLPDEIVHGTFLRHWNSILEEGLLAGGRNGAESRNHVHFATGLPSSGSVISGTRDSCEVATYLDVEKALQEGRPCTRARIR